ncbi:ABC transporter substrate-binding protein [Streptomyces sp. TS71-3]|uniref:ABC transporter substrate-binding protein n=1 Tax=Streptomyces sp. TS71-3 TaxID=2733862 RepID=UPI001AFF57F4|nr:extracellular solute-binding protein [Streptomyces sp. TS71-3]GHJ41586.1 sugar ABC transporter substrate-binding protein [Streptomyces sp. TS71-3]
MLSTRRGVRGGVALSLLSCLALAATACGGGGDTASSATRGVTINVALAIPSPPKASLDAFTKSTGITVHWTNIDWDSLQTKIAAAATAHTYFADATDVDWSRVGQLSKLKWFYPMQDYVDTKALAPDMPQLTSFTVGKEVVGVPFDASFLTTTVNKEMFAKAGITTMPKTLAEYTADLKKVKAKGVVDHPLDIPFAAAEGLSTYWYQATAAFGGTVLDAHGKPQFTSPGSAGYKAAQWMTDAIKQGLVAPGNINTTDSQGTQTEMAKGRVASVFSDYSGNVGSLYDVPSASTVTKQVVYVPTPGATGPAPNLSNPDGIGIPRTAKYPAAAAKFIKWFTSADQQAAFAGIDGPDKTLHTYSLPSRLSAVHRLGAKGDLVQAGAMSSMLASSTRPVFPQGAPSWYPQFSNSVYTNLHAAATGSQSVGAAIKAIAATANRLAGGS